MRMGQLNPSASSRRQSTKYSPHDPAHKSLFRNYPEFVENPQPLVLFAQSMRFFPYKIVEARRRLRTIVQRGVTLTLHLVQKIGQAMIGLDL
jgi:hypothetical protein